MKEHEHCERLLQNLSDYIDGDLLEDACAELEKHLASCEHCTVVYDTIRKTIALYQEEPDAELPGEVKLRLYKKLNLHSND